MKITTVSLNPAIDQTVYINNFRINQVNRGESMGFEPGGKGINVAIFLSDYAHLSGISGEPAVTATGFIGRENAEIFEKLFSERHIGDRFIRIPGRNRIGVKIVDEAQQQTTDINMPGLSPSNEAVDLIIRTLRSLTEECRWFVLTGSLPPGVPVGLYPQMIQLLQSNGCQVLLDSSGEALRRGVEARPAIVKPNLIELEELAGRPLSGPTDNAPADAEMVSAAAARLLQGDTTLVIITMGYHGSLFVTRQEALLVIPPAIPVKGTVGAGDALAAGVLCGLDQGLSLAETGRLATAFAMVAITSPTRGLSDLASLNAFARQVVVLPVG